MSARIGWRGAVAWCALCAIAACGGASIEDVCEEVAACEEGESVEECVRETEDLERAAEEVGCSGEFDDFLDCAGDTISCVDGQTQIDCNEEQEAMLRCGGGSRVGMGEG